MNLDNNYDWKFIYSNVFSNTLDTKLIWFQCRIVHNILATNNFLQKIGIKNDPNCCFCNNEIENIKHIFYDCYCVKRLWNDIKNWFNENNNEHFAFTLIDILFLKNGKKFKAFNTCIILIKNYIYKKRFFDKVLEFEEIKFQLKSYYEIEKYMYKIRGEIEIFNRRWAILKIYFLTSMLLS